MHAGRSGKDGSSFKRTTSVLPKVSFGNPRGSMDMQLPAVFISDDKGYLSPVVPGRNPRRSVDTPSHFKPMFSPTPNSREAEEGGVRGGDMQLASRNPSSSLGKEEAAKITKQRVAQEKKTLGRPSGSSDLLTIAVPSKSLDFAGMKKSMLYLNPTFGDTGGRGQEKISVPRLGKTRCGSTMQFLTARHLSCPKHADTSQHHSKSAGVGKSFLSCLSLVMFTRTVRSQSTLYRRADCCRSIASRL